MVVEQVPARFKGQEEHGVLSCIFWACPCTDLHKWHAVTESQEESDEPSGEEDRDMSPEL